VGLISFEPSSKTVPQNLWPSLSQLMKNHLLQTILATCKPTSAPKLAVPGSSLEIRLSERPLPISLTTKVSLMSHRLNWFKFATLRSHTSQSQKTKLRIRRPLILSQASCSWRRKNLARIMFNQAPQHQPTNLQASTVRRPGLALSRLLCPALAQSRTSHPPCSRWTKSTRLPSWTCVCSTWTGTHVTSWCRSKSKSRDRLRANLFQLTMDLLFLTLLRSNPLI